MVGAAVLIPKTFTTATPLQEVKVNIPGGQVFPRKQQGPTNYFIDWTNLIRTRLWSSPFCHFGFLRSKGLVQNTQRTSFNQIRFRRSEMSRLPAGQIADNEALSCLIIQCLVSELGVLLVLVSRIQVQ
jgi:hypothetical protein